MKTVEWNIDSVKTGLQSIDSEKTVQQNIGSVKTVHQNIDVYGFLYAHIGISRCYGVCALCPCHPCVILA